jgi:hypothetical protein
MTLGEERDSLAHGLAIVAVLPSLLLVGSAFLKAPAAFDPFLTQRVPEDHER